jgi:predicted nuclease of restriction endonuclease-like RecB superfamily
MRLSLDDIKKTISRRGGQPFLTPYLLRPGEMEAPIGALIGLHDAWIGRPRTSFPDDRPSELIGDYRLARCLVGCLSEWYEWRSPAWPGKADTAEAQALAERGIASSSDLRLALYDHVNASAGGYLPNAERESMLDAFAGAYGLRRSTLDALLDLDADDRAELVRMGEAAPSAWELAARYNQRAVEALLFNSASVEWHIPADASDGSGGGLGTVVKRICFLARTMGVQYDVAFEQPTATDDVPGYDLQLRRVAERSHSYALTSLDSLRRPLSITLYGPQEVMGVPNQYGERLARLCRALLGYRRKRGGKAALAGKGLRGAARVYLHGRPVTFLLDEQLLSLMDAAVPSSPRQPTSLAGVLETDEAAFDSSLERKLHDEFSALERAGEAHGWHLEREPEPLIVGGVIVVPDFAVTRGFKQVYLEIAGYWRPDYRERKVRKLNALRDSVSQVVAAPEPARADFAALDPTIPILWYGNRVSAAALLGLLDRAYDDFAQRLATLDPAQIQAEVQTRGCVPATEAFVLLHCYTRSELAAALDHINGAPSEDSSPSIHWIEGLGLCSTPWLATLLERIRVHVESTADGRLSLSALTERIVAEVAELRDASPASIELLAAQVGLTVSRASIFDVEVLSPNAAPPSGPVSAAPATTRSGQSPQPRGSVRRKQQQKPPQPAYTATSIFSFIPSERPGNDETEPDTPSRAREQMPGDAAEGGAQ